MVSLRAVLGRLEAAKHEPTAVFDRHKLDEAPDTAYSSRVAAMVARQKQLEARRGLKDAPSRMYSYSLCPTAL